MKYCKNCGAQLSDNATFCGRCGTPAATQAQPQTNTGGLVGGVASDYRAPVNVNRPGGLISKSSEDVLMMVQGILAIIVALLATLAPVIEVKANGISSTTNMVTILTFLGPVIGSLSSIISTITKVGNMSGVSGNDLAQYASINDALGAINIWAVVITIIGFIALVGVFLTAARTLEKTNKSTLITGWLFMPFGISIILYTNIITSSIRDILFLANMSAAFGTSSGSLEISVTFWPWVILILGVACGVVGVLLHLSNKTQGTPYSANPTNSTNPTTQAYPNQPPIQY